MKSFFVPLRSTQKDFKNIVLYLVFIFYLNWVTSIYNAEFFLHITKSRLEFFFLKSAFIFFIFPFVSVRIPQVAQNRPKASMVFYLFFSSSKHEKSPYLRALRHCHLFCQCMMSCDYKIDECIFAYVSDKNAVMGNHHCIKNYFTIFSITQSCFFVSLL